MRGHPARFIPVFIITSFASAAGCGGPSPPSHDDLKLGNDQSSDGKEGTAGNSPDGKQAGSIELGDGTTAPDPATEPPRDDGDGNTSNAAPTTCTKDVECNQAGRICTASACVKGCRSSDQCPTGQACTSAGQCDFASANVECYFDADCALGAICVADACKPGCHADLDCPTGQSCTSGMCKAASGTTPPAGGVTCASDGQCNPGVNGAGKICSAQGACVDGCHADNQCPGSKICASGTCR